MSSDCPVCDHLHLATEDPVAAIVGIAYAVKAVGFEAFKDAMCRLHRDQYPMALIRCAQHVTHRSDYTDLQEET